MGARPIEAEALESESGLPITEPAAAAPKLTIGNGPTDLGAQVWALAWELGVGENQEMAPPTAPTGTGGKPVA